MIIRLADNRDKAAWDAFVSNHEEATPYHRFAWREAVEKAYGHQGHYLIAEEDGRIIGVSPLIFMRCPLLYRKLVSLPFCDLGGILATRDDAAQGLYDEAISLAKSLSASTLELRCRAEITDLPHTDLPCSTRTDKVSMVLNLPSSATALWDGSKSKLRSQVRKAEKNELSFSWREETDRKDFYDVFSKNMRELGSPVHSCAWIDAVRKGFGTQARMGLVYHDKKPVGAGIILCQGRTVSIPWASTLREYNSFSQNMLLYWNFLQFAADNGYNQFDFGRSTLDEGTYRFKAQWGAEPQKLLWHTIYFDQPAAAAQEANPASSSSTRERLAKLWGMQPLWMANLLGPLLRRHISL